MRFFNNTSTGFIRPTTALLGVVFVVMLIIAGTMIRNLTLQRAVVSSVAQDNAPSPLLSIVKDAIPGDANDLKTDLNGRMNVVFAGIPGPGNPAPNLTDTLLLGSIVPRSQNPAETISITSIPRDFLVKPVGGEYYTRINSIYGANGANELAVDKLVATMEQVTGLDIHHFVVVDLSVLIELVDIFGGINVFVPEDIHDPKFPGPNFSYETFKIEKGWRYLDGDQASRYARTRNDEENDFGRMKRQQAVIQALIKKAKNESTIGNFSNAIQVYNALSGRVSTNLKVSELKALWEIMGRVDISQIDITSLRLGRNNALLKDQRVKLGGYWAPVLVPVAGQGDYSDIQAYFREHLK